jgi:hypothetical protein
MQAFFDFLFAPFRRYTLSVSETMVCKTRKCEKAVVPYTVSGLDDRDILARVAVGA